MTRKSVASFIMFFAFLFFVTAPAFADGDIGDEGFLSKPEKQEAAKKAKKPGPPDPGPNPAGELTPEEAAKTLRVGTIIANQIVAGKENVHKQTVHRQYNKKQFNKKSYTRQAYVNKQKTGELVVKGKATFEGPSEFKGDAHFNQANIDTANIGTANIDKAYVNELYAKYFHADVFEHGVSSRGSGKGATAKYTGSGNCPTGDCIVGTYVANTTQWGVIDGGIDLVCASDTSKVAGSCASKIWVPGVKVPAGPAGIGRVQVVCYNSDPDRTSFGSAVARAKLLLGHASKYDGPVTERYGKTCEYQLH